MSVLADFQVSGSNPSTVGGTGSIAKYFPRILGSSIGNASTSPSASNAAGQLVIPAVGEVNGKIFKVRVGGDILPFTGGNNSTVDLVANIGTVASPNWVAIVSTGAIAFTSATPVNWFMDVTLFGTNNSGATPGLLSGYYWTSFNNSNNGVNQQTPITNPPSGIDFVKGQSGAPGAIPGAVIGLAVRATFSVSLAQNFARLTQFQITD